MSVGVVNKTTGDRIPTAGMPAIDSVLSGTSTNPVQNRVVKAALDEKADTDIVASDFDATASYTAGNYCIYEGKFYKFKASHSGAWSAADVDEIKIAGELSALKSGLIDVNNSISPLINGLKVAVVPSGTDRKIKITRSYEKQCFFVMSNNNYHPFFGIISQLDGETNHLQSVPQNTGFTVSLTDNIFEFNLISYFGGLTIVSSQDFTVTAEPVT